MGCKVFTIRVLIRERLKFVKIRLVMRKETLKRLLSSFWVQFLHLEVWKFVASSLSIELDNRCVKMPPFIVLNTACAIIRTRDACFHDTRSNTLMIEIRSNSMSIATRNDKTPPFVFLSTRSSFRRVNDCISSIIDRIGQPMC